MASGAYRSLTIELNATTSGLDAALRKSSTEANKLERELKEAQRAAKLDGAGADTFARQMDLMAHRIDAAKDKLKKLQAIAAKNGQVVDGKEQRLSADAWSKLNFEVEKTNAEIQKYTAMMRELVVAQGSANSALGKAGEAITEAGERLEPIGKTMQGLGRAMTVGVTVPIVGAATASVKAATDIDTALTGVRKTVTGTEEQYQALKDAAIEFSKSNGVAASTMLDIQALGAQLGFGQDNIEELKQFSEVVAGLDIATNLDAETAATELAQFFNIMGENHDMTSNFASTIVALGNTSATTEADIMNMAMRIAGAGKSIGLSSAEVLGLSASLSSVGIQAEAGGTAISTILSSIDKDVATGSENLSRWAALAGTSAEEFAAAWQNNALAAFQDVVAGMQNGGENLSVLLEELGISSLRQTDVMKRLANASDMLPKSIRTANEAYAENTALANEVANFNDSLAVKFEMLRNRVTAVAAEVGAPLADAMLEAIGAAEPLFEAIESGARAFAEMSDEEQGAVIQTVAIVAAVGPALTLFGKVASNVKVLGGAMSTLATWLARIDVATGGAKDGITQVGDASGKMTAKLKPASVAMGALKGAAIGLAVAGIAVLASAIGDYLEKQRQFESATKGLGRAIDALDAPIQAAGSGTDGLGASAESTAGKLRNYSRAAEDAAKKGAELAERMGETFSGAQSDAALAQHYADVINELAGNCNGSSEKFYRLKEAVEKYNEITGSSYAVTDEFSGRINAQTGELDANTEAFKRNVYAKAASSMAEESAKHEIELEMDLAGVRDQLSSKTDELTRVNEKLADGSARSASEIEALSQQADQLARDMDGLKKNEGSLTAQRDAAKEATDRLLGKQAEYAQQADEEAARARDLAASTAGYAQALEQAGEGSDAFANLAQGLGVEVDDLAGAMGSAGVKTEELAQLGSESFARLYNEAGGSIDGVISALAVANAFDLDPKTLTVNDDGTVATVEGHIIDLANQTIDGKHFEVSDDGTIKIATDDVEYLQNFRLGDKQFHVTAIDNASATIDDVIRKASQLNGATMTVSLSLNNAAGGISLTPIRRHADGGITARPTLTNVGMVGEAGAEAIIPLTNRRYVRPFAQAVASEMGPGGSSSVTNIYIDGVQALPDSRIYDVSYELATTILDQRRA